MFAQVFNTFSEQSKLFVEPALEFNRIALGQLQKLGEKQLTLINEYSKLGFAQIEKASKVQTAEDFSSITEEQLKATADMSRKLADDTTALVTLGQEMGNEWKQYAEARFESFTAQVKPAKTTRK